MESFCFAELLGFLQTALGMVIAYLAGKQAAKPKKKSRPHSKDCGSSKKKH